MNKKKTTILLFSIYLLIITWIILFKAATSLKQLPHIRNINLIPLAGSVIVNNKIYWDEIINNAVIFIPVGIYISMLKTTWSIPRKILPILCLSLLYETLQFIFAIGATDITDVISNTLGGSIGIGIYFIFRKLFKTEQRTNRVINTLASICTMLIIILLFILILFN